MVALLNWLNLVENGWTIVDVPVEAQPAEKTAANKQKPQKTVRKLNFIADCLREPQGRGEFGYALKSFTASTQRAQIVGCSGVEPTSVSQCQQRSHF